MGTITKLTDAVKGKGKGRGRVEEETKVDYDEEVLEEAQKYLGNWEIETGGGWRKSDKRTYWLPLPELIEFEKADQRIKDDEEFWQWFEDFRKDKDLKQRKSVSWDDHRNNDWRDWGGSTKTKWWTGSSGSYWGGGSYGYGSSWGSSKDDALARKLALALKAIQTPVSVVNTSGVKFRVEFSSDRAEAPESATMISERRVVISPQAIIDDKMTTDEGIIITTGYGLHEASHVEYTPNPEEVLAVPTKLLPLGVAGLLANVVEDVRIEAQTIERFPGFEDYLVEARKYLWGITNEHMPKEWGPDLKDKLNAIIAMVKWQTDYASIASADPELAAQEKWFTDWRDRYVSQDHESKEMTGKYLRQAVIEALAHLKEDPQTEEQMRQQAADEQAAQTAFESFKAEVEAMIKKLGAMQPCSGGHGTNGRGLVPGDKKDEIDEDTMEKAEGFIIEGLEAFEPLRRVPDAFGNQGGPEIIVRRPVETAESIEAYRKPGPLVERLRAAFFFRKSAAVHHDRMLRNGVVDEEEVWRLADGDYRVFERKTIAETPETQVTLLVDSSGSMLEGIDKGQWSRNGVQKLSIAQDLATTMIECLRTTKGIRPRVRAHSTGDGVMMLEADNLSGTSEVIKVWDVGDPMTRLGTMTTEMEHGCNFDGFAIERVCEEMLAERRPNEDMVLIVLSDGKPNGSGWPYGGEPAMQHVHDVVNDYERKGITIIQIALDPELRSNDQATMFSHWIQFETAEKLPMQLTKLLISLFGGA